MIAPHFAQPLVRACGALATPVRSAPDGESEAVSELLPGEEFAVLEYAGGWAWGYCRPDHLVGYVEAIELADPIEPSHIVCEKLAPVTADDRVTAPILANLPMGALLHGEEHGACLSTEYGCVPLSHLRRIGDWEEDPVIVAERLIGAPWRAGGRTQNGVDAAGLVELALELCGLAAPRLLEHQHRLGDPVPDEQRLKRGDLVFFDGAVAMMIDDQMLIHASREAGRVVVEPLAAVGGRTPVAERRRPGF